MKRSLADRFSQHWKIDRCVPLEEFAYWKKFALDLDLGGVESGPFVRSSYHADEQSQKFTGVEHFNTSNLLRNA